MALVLIGSIAAITDAVAASLVSGATATRDAVDQRVRTTIGTDLIPELSTSPAIIQAAQNAVNQALANGDLGWSKGLLPLTSDADQTVALGVHRTRPATTNLPNGATSGWLEVVPQTTVYVSQVYTDAEGWQATRPQFSNGGWGDWSSKAHAPVPPAGTDFDTLTTDNTWTVPSSGGNYSNTPFAGFVGKLFVSDVKNSTGNVQQQIAVAYAPLQRILIRQRNTAGVWGAWKEIAFSDVSHADPGAGRRSAVVAEARRRRGGRVATRGLPAVALRFDHHLSPFKTKVLPLLEQYRLPWGQMLNANNLGKGTDVMTNAEIQEACFRSGGEVWNHSWSHVGLVTEGAADLQVTRGLTDLKAALPALWIDGWAPPGTSEGYLGADGADSPEKFWNSYPGRLILAQHGLIRGYYPGIYQELRGENLIGQAHAVLDQQDAAWAGAVLRGAIDSGRGVTFMLHPNYLDTSGYMTTAQLGTVLADIAARRDAGELVVCSPSGILLADSTAEVSNLLSSAGAGAVTSSWSQTVSTRSGPRQYGVPHEAEAWVKATAAGTVSLRVQVTAGAGNVNQVHSVTVTAGQVVRLGVVVTPPLDTTQTVVTLTGNVTHTGIRYRAI